MKDCRFDIYDERYVHLFGEFKNGCMQLTSLIFGEDRDSEMISPRKRNAKKQNGCLRRPYK